MGRPSRFPVEDKLRIVLSVLSGEMTIVEAAGWNKTSEQSIGRWRQQFLEGGKAGLAEGGGSSTTLVGVLCRSRSMS
jgi:transposase